MRVRRLSEPGNKQIGTHAKSLLELGLVRAMPTSRRPFATLTVVLLMSRTYLAPLTERSGGSAPVAERQQPIAYWTALHTSAIVASSTVPTLRVSEERLIV